MFSLKALNFQILFLFEIIFLLLLLFALDFTTLWAYSTDDKLVICFLIFLRKQEFDISANRHEMSTNCFCFVCVCVCVLFIYFLFFFFFFFLLVCVFFGFFLWKNKKHILICRLLKILPRVLCVKGSIFLKK